jgi:hypothetical protein
MGAVVFAANPPAGAGVALKACRCRWRAELHFKRLKPIMGFGSAPKKTDEGAAAWANGGLTLAPLIETLLSAASFSPYERCGRA